MPTGPEAAAVLQAIVKSGYGLSEDRVVDPCVTKKQLSLLVPTDNLVFSFIRHVIASLLSLLHKNPALLPQRQDTCLVTAGICAPQVSIL